MNDMTNTSAESTDKYFLEEQEIWASLGFDWEDWKRNRGKKSCNSNRYKALRTRLTPLQSQPKRATRNDSLSGLSKCHF